MRLTALPGWVIGDAASVQEEVARLGRLTVAERWAATCLCARDALWALRQSPDPERALALEDPLPESSRVALARLRARRTPPA